MSIAFAVSSIPARAELAHDLVGLLQFGAGMVFPDVADVRHYVDDPPSGSSWSNYRRALLDAGSSGEEWLVSIDDDAEVCENFVTRVRDALAVCPGDFASFYLSRWRTTERAREELPGASWIATLRVVHGICYAVRAHLAREVIEVAERLVRPEHYSGDQRIHAWLCETRRPNYIAIPNLVNHRRELESALIPGRKNFERQSASFVEDQSNIERTPLTWIDRRSSPARAMRNLALRGALIDGSRGYPRSRWWRTIQL